MDPVRSSPGSVLFTTYNLFDLGAGDSAGGAEHYATVAESIRALRTDVLAVQEICAPGLPAARTLLRQLADDTGLRCLVPGPGGQGVPALCPGSRGYHLGLLWRDGIEPVPGSFHSRNADFWHALGWVSLDVGGPVARHAVYHASPFGRKIRADQSEIVVAALARPGGRVVGADLVAGLAGDGMTAQGGPAAQHTGGQWPGGCVSPVHGGAHAAPPEVARHLGHSPCSGPVPR